MMLIDIEIYMFESKVYNVLTWLVFLDGVIFLFDDENSIYSSRCVKSLICSK